MNELIFWIVVAVLTLIVTLGLWAEYIRQLKQHDWRRPLSNSRRPK